MGIAQEYLAAKAVYDKRKMLLRVKLGALHDNLSQIRNRMRTFIQRVERDVNNKR